MEISTQNTATADTTEHSQHIYKFFPYDSKQSYPAPDGMRLTTCLYRAAKEGETAKHENVGMFVPDWISLELVTEKLPILGEHIIAWLQSMDDSRIKASYESASKGFGDSYFSIDMLLAYLEEKNTSARLSGEQITEWFTSSELKEAMLQLYTEKSGSAEKAAKIVAFLEKKLKSLASPKTYWSQEEQDKILPLLETVDDTAIGRKLVMRIKAMSVEEEQDLIDAL